MAKRTSRKGNVPNCNKIIRLHLKEIMRMSPDQFKEILNATEPGKQSTKMGGEPIAPVERRALTLRFLATGESF